MFYGESENWRKKDLIAGGNKIIAVGFFYLQSLQYCRWTYGFTIAGGDHQREVLAVLTPLPRVKYRLYRMRNHIFNVTILPYSKKNWKPARRFGRSSTCDRVGKLYIYEPAKGFVRPWFLFAYNIHIFVSSYFSHSHSLLCGPSLSLNGRPAPSYHLKLEAKLIKKQMWKDRYEMVGILTPLVVSIMALAWKSFFWPKWVSSKKVPSLTQWLGWLEPGGARSLDCITTTCPPPLLPLWLSAGPSPVLVTDQVASYSSGKSARKSDFVIWSWFTVPTLVTHLS